MARGRPSPTTRDRPRSPRHIAAGSRRRPSRKALDRRDVRAYCQAMLTVSDVHTAGSGSRTQPHAVVIGSGFGGLAGALRLLARGYRVTVLEKLDAPGGRGYQLHQDGFTFDAGPTIITAPFLFEELWALFGRGCRTTSTCGRSRRSTRSASPTATTFKVSGDADAMRAEVARFDPSDVAGFERFLKRARRSIRIGFEQLGDAALQLAHRHGEGRPQPSAPRRAPQRLPLVSKYMKDERLRTVFSFHPLLIGGNPFRASAIYCLIAYLERQLGVHYAIGGTGALVRGLVDLIAIAGRRSALRGRSRADPGQGRRRDRRAARHRRNDRGQRRRLQRRFRLDLPQSRAAASRDGGGRTARSTAPAIPWACSSGISASTGATTTSAHHTILLGPRYRELLRDIFDKQGAGRRFQPLSPSSDRDRPFARARGLRCVLRALAGAQPARRTGLETEAEALPEADRAGARSDDASGSVERDRHLEVHHAARLPGPAERLSRRGLRARADPDPERLVPSAQQERGRAQPVPGRRRHPSRARACPACSPPRAFSTRSFRMPQFSFDLASRSDQRECRDSIRVGSKTFYAASRLLPAEVRQRAFALYAFCRLSDDAVDIGGRLARRGRPPEAIGSPARRKAGRGVTRPIARFSDAMRRCTIPARDARGAARRARLGRRGADATRRSTTFSTTPPASPARSG